LASGPPTKTNFHLYLIVPYSCCGTIIICSPPLGDPPLSHRSPVIGPPTCFFIWPYYSAASGYCPGFPTSLMTGFFRKIHFVPPFLGPMRWRTTGLAVFGHSLLAQFFIPGGSFPKSYCRRPSLLCVLLRPCYILPHWSLLRRNLFITS